MAEYRFQWILNALIETMQTLAAECEGVRDDLTRTEHRIHEIRNHIDETNRQLHALTRRRMHISGVISSDEIKRQMDRIAAFRVREVNLADQIRELERYRGRIASKLEHRKMRIAAMYRRKQQFEAQKEAALDQKIEERDISTRRIEREFLDQFAFRRDRP
ncbi:MAG TPA: hypothetical protein PLV45_05630 [bacterium]|nr:hypothetical protein [bacterium]